MRYIVFGSGGIGSALGGMLVHNGMEAVLVARPAHRDAISKAGLLISSSEGETAGELRIDVPAVASLDELDRTGDDCVLLTVKTQDTPKALEKLSGWADPQTPIACLQNGVRNEAMAMARFSRVVAGLVNFNANFLSPGRIERTLWNTIGLGLYPEGLDPLVEEIAADLKRACFDVHLHPHIMRAKWGKLVANLNNSTNAITDRHLQKALSEPEHRRFMAEVMAEGILVLDRAGIELDDGGVFDARSMVESLRRPSAKDNVKENVLAVKAEGESYPSTWQDLALGRKETEVRFFNGEIVGLAASLGMATPYNSVLLEVAERMAIAGEKPGRHTLEELKAMVSTRKDETGEGRN
jgi:2-dehydropantoate 2-reductase